MNEMINEALNVAYRFVSAASYMQDVALIDHCLCAIAGTNDFHSEDTSEQMSFGLSAYSETQSLLSRLNERESIRKSKGVYYTPADVVRFIVANTIKSSFGLLFPNNIGSNDISRINIESFCKEKTVFEPTCGAGEFLLETLEKKFELWITTHEETPRETIESIVGTIYGNDINHDSVVISKLRLFIASVNRFGFDKCRNLPAVLNSHFTENDYVVSPPDNDERYDLILGNPPYVEDNKCGLNLVVKYGNIYANVLENAAKHLAPGGSMGFIIPLSYSSTPRMKRIRETLLRIIPEQYVLSYADRPDCLFDSVHQKLCILIGRNTNTERLIYTGNYQYWYQEERENLFSNTSVIENPFMSDDCIPKLGTPLDRSIFEKVTNSDLPTVFSVSRKGIESVYVNRRETFWIKAFREPHIHPEFKIFSYSTKAEADYCYCLVNSSLFWWYWIATSDCWHISRELNGFRAPVQCDLSIAQQLAASLSKKLEETKAFVGTKQTDYEYKHKLCINQIQAIDDFVNDLFGLTYEESDYIKNFALRYRISGGTETNESN